MAKRADVSLKYILTLPDQVFVVAEGCFAIVIVIMIVIYFPQRT